MHPQKEGGGGGADVRTNTQFAHNHGKWHVEELDVREFLYILYYNNQQIATAKVHRVSHLDGTPTIIVVLYKKSLKAAPIGNEEQQDTSYFFVEPICGLCYELLDNIYCPGLLMTYAIKHNIGSLRRATKHRTKVRNKI